MPPASSPVSSRRSTTSRPRLERQQWQSATTTRCWASSGAPSDGDIKKAFRRLARELHPDVNAHDPAAEEKFKEAAEAYEVLSDPERRQTYDRFGHDGLRSGGFTPGATGFGSFQDVFDALFGGGDPFGGFGAGPASGADVGAVIEIGLDEVLEDQTREVSFEAVSVCDRCRGNGAEPGTPIETCDRCEGTGQIREVSRSIFGQVVRAMPCDKCGGDGRIPETPCERCGGCRASFGDADLGGRHPGGDRGRSASADRGRRACGRTRRAPGRPLRRRSGSPPTIALPARAPS